MLYVLFLVFGIFCLIRELMLVLRHTRFQIINIFGIMYGLVYGILPAYFNLLYDYNRLSDTFMDNHVYLGVWLLFAVMAYVVIQVVYYSRKKEFNIVVNKKNSSKELLSFQICAMTCLCIGILSMIIWTNAHGGIYKFILSANAIRGGWDTTYNAFAFFKHPARIVIITTFFFQILVMLNYKRFLNIIMFAISFIFAILFLLANDGRLPIMTFLVTILMIRLKFLDRGSVTPKVLIILFLCAFIGIVGIQNMDRITYYIRTGYSLNEFKTNVSFIEQEFSYIIKAALSSTNQLFTGECPYLIWEDIKSGIFAWLPSSLKPNDLIDLWNYNTMQINGDFYQGQLPTDFISASIYDLGFIGWFVFALFWGYIIKKVDLLVTEKKNLFNYVLGYFLVAYFLGLPQYTMLYSTVLYFFNIAVAFILWVICKKTFIRN